MRVSGLVAVLALTAGVRAFIDCRTACKSCRAKTGSANVLEVYCSMCKECRDRRKEKMKLAAGARGSPAPQAQHQLLKYAGPPPQPECQSEGAFGNSCGGLLSPVFPPGCPTPPYCEPDYEDRPQALPLAQTRMTPPPTPRSPPTPPPCPPVAYCRRRRRAQVTCGCAVCPCPMWQMIQMPMVQMPMYNMMPPIADGNAPAPPLVLKAPETTTDFFYVFIGVPKGVQT